MTVFFAEFEVLGEPKGQPRPKATMRGKHAGVFDPGTANRWKSNVIHAATPHKPAKALDCPISLEIDFRFLCTQQERKRKACPLIDYRRQRPDLDNLVKSTMDALTDMGFWTDDSLIVSLTATKSNVKEETPGAMITIRAIA